MLDFGIRYNKLVVTLFLCFVIISTVTLSRISFIDKDVFLSYEQFLFVWPPHLLHY